MVDIVREVFKKRNIKVDYNLMEWDKAKQSAQAGTIQGVVGASRGDGDFVFPKNALGRYQNFLFFLPDTARKKGVNFDSKSSLAKVKIGIVKDYAYGPQADQFIAKNPDLFTKASGDEPLVQMLQWLDEGKVDAIYECPQVFLYKLKLLKKNYDTFRRGLSFDEKPEDLYVAFSKKTAKASQYAEILDEGIAKMRESGRLMRVLDNYSLTDWQ